MLRQTVYETVNSSWRPSCASIRINVDSFGYYFTSQNAPTNRLRNRQLFVEPSCARFPSTKTRLDTTLRPENAPTNRLRNHQLFVETFLCIDFHQ
ncbi:uncharacterized protein LACBIDRAFT_312683 [Laccaria bicolor S238N-H82]|uniref:Predicted protein n=1 Tax=Laccaria bicolor (strain S238N-H82 / ATCC MYA-4686) TaxID=486041 RepID=B0DWQ7_LACBS|nr:uncharacterized protein LACBIDRAFT_312683 [Laccaria bicolor S238N-H82]EDR00974.1 predicted protein [Laccaria bicolor S238N-H82]|eukprot:XP_001888369.1 predicted protein [Laccaria bicolor S238N-H82]